MIKKKKNILILIGILAFLWCLFLIINLCRLNNRNKPIMCIGTELKKDNGSGHYVCLGYSFDIEGNFNPEDKNYGVNKYTFYLLGIKINEETIIKG
ncbi:MAG: hypothetical protein IJ568_05075 [Bacilli bacterium]|nr:hypothetical protein [Bacilli bacterium]